MNCPICGDGLNEEFDGDSWIYKCDFCQYCQYILEPDFIEMTKDWYGEQQAGEP
jgi:hypothetical protein